MCCIETCCLTVLCTVGFMLTGTALVDYVWSRRG